MKGNWQNVCYRRTTTATSTATEGFFQESGRETQIRSFAMFLEMQLTWQTLVKPGTQGHVRLDVTRGHRLAAAAWVRISPWDKVGGNVFPFNLPTNPVGRAGWEKRSPVWDRKTSQQLTREADYVTLLHPSPRTYRVLGGAPPDFCKSNLQPRLHQGAPSKLTVRKP